MIDLPLRPRRNRKTETIRKLVEETSLRTSDLIFPMFLIEGQNKKTAIPSMPGIFRFSQDKLMEEISSCQDLGVKSVVLFPSLSDNKKDRYATESLNPEGLYLQSISQIKNMFPDICVMTDAAMDPYSTDGHDGFVQNGEIINDITVDILAKMAVAQAKAGADIIGPSDMMDGRVGAIRKALDTEGFTHTSVMSYTAKYASAFYGPFRDALDSAPRFGDKKTYQMNPANRYEALLEAQLDIEEGADFLMVKPALSYLDIISDLKNNFPIPIAAYNVSGEYAMIKAASSNGWIDGEKAMMECLISIKRAGAKIILTYFAKEAAALINNG